VVVHNALSGRAVEELDVRADDGHLVGLSKIDE
jgi:hypothetical protein